MKHRVRQWAVVLTMAALLGGTAGCLPSLLPTDWPALLSGWVLRGLAIPTSDQSLTCYRNGVPIDCSEVPENLGSGGG